jgi:hypothetical protein
MNRLLATSLSVPHFCSVCIFVKEMYKYFVKFNGRNNSTELEPQD